MNVERTLIERMTASAGRPVKVALGSVPKDGGTFTFYRNIRPALLAAGFDLRCVTLGRDEARLVERAYVDDGCVLLEPRAAGRKRQARTFVDWCEAEDVDIVVALNSEGMLAALPHLPERVRVMARCANAFDHGYRISMSGRERLTRIVALTPRLRDDLVAGYGADPAKVVLIPNGIAPGPFDPPSRRRRGEGSVLELGFLGRLEHNQKGVLHLPGIVRALKARGVPFRLRIAGKGRHEPDLRAALADEIGDGGVVMVGALGPDAVPAFLGESDVFVFTSHFEGCPNALLEAMMAGAVPVSWRIDGITDFLIDDGRTGRLCDSGDAEAFASRVADLHADRETLDAMRRATAAEARARFTDEVAARSYAALFHQIATEAAPAVVPKAWRDFTPDPNFPNTWRRRIPEPAKAACRRLVRPFRAARRAS